MATQPSALPFGCETLGGKAAGCKNAELCGEASTGHHVDNDGQIALSIGYGRLSLIRFNAISECYEWTSKGHESYLIVRMFLEGLHAAALAPIRRGVGSSPTASGLTAFLSRQPSLGSVSDEFFGLLWSELRHVIWTEISLLCMTSGFDSDIMKSGGLQWKDDSQEKLHTCLTLVVQLAKRFPHLKALYHSWDNLTGGLPDRIVDAQCPGIIQGIRDSIKFLKDCFEEATKEVSEALLAILEQPLSEKSAKVWIAALVGYFDLTTKMLGEFAVFSEILAGPARAPKRATAKAKFKSTIHTVNVIASFIKRQPSTIDDAEMQILKLTGRLNRSQRVDSWKLLMQFGVNRAISGASLLQSTLVSTSPKQALLADKQDVSTPRSMQKQSRLSRFSEDLCMSELSLMASTLKLDQDKVTNETIDCPAVSPLVMGILSSASHMRTTGAARSSGMIGSPVVGLFYPPKSPGLRGTQDHGPSLFQHASRSTVHCLYSWFLHHLREAFELNHREITLGWNMTPSRCTLQGQPADSSHRQAMSDPTGISAGQEIEGFTSKSFTSGCLGKLDSPQGSTSPASFTHGSPPSKLPALAMVPMAVKKPLGKPLQLSWPLGTSLQASPTPMRNGVDVQPLPRQMLHPLSSTLVLDPSPPSPEKPSGSDISFPAQRTLHWAIPIGMLLPPWLTHYVDAIRDDLVGKRWDLLLDSIEGSTTSSHYLKVVELLHAIEKGILWFVMKKDKLKFEKSDSEFTSPTVLKAREMLISLCTALKSVQEHPYTKQSEIVKLREKVALIATQVVEVFVNWAVHWQPLYPTGATIQHLCIIHSDMLKVIDALDVLLGCMHNSAKFTTPPWMRRDEAQPPEAAELVASCSTPSRAPPSGIDLDDSGKIGAFRGVDVDDAHSTDRSIGVSGDSIKRNQIFPIGGGCDERDSACTSRGTDVLDGRSDRSQCDNESERRHSSSQAGPRDVHDALKSVGPEYPSVVKKALRMNFKSVLAARRFKWRQANVGTNLHSQQGNVWLDIREARSIKHFRELISTIKLHVGGLTDKLSQEFREAAQKLWATSPPSTWCLRSKPLHPSTGASHVIDHLLEPLSNTLNALDVRSYRALLGSAFASSAQAECDLIPAAIQNAHHRMTTAHYALQLKLDVAAMRGACAIRQDKGEAPDATAQKGALNGAPGVDQFGDSEAGVIERVECIIQILSSSQKDIKLSKLKRVINKLPDAEKWERLSR